MFEDRSDAGRRLAEALAQFNSKDPAVIALPRGGVPVAFEVAKRLNAPLDVLIVRKLGYPGQPDLAIGAVADGRNPEIFINHDFSDDATVPKSYLENEIAIKLQEIHKMAALFRGHRHPIGLRDRTVIAVDDGIATGSTMRVVVQRLRQDSPKEIIVATPVASQEAIEILKAEADRVVCLDAPPHFVAVGNFYRDFSQVANEEVIAMLDQAQLPKAIS